MCVVAERQAEVADVEDELYDERFLVRRPLLRSLSTTDGVPPVLLIDEVDRADDEFEALMRKHQAGASVADGASENNDNEMANPVGEAAEKRAGGVRALFAPGVRRPFFVGCMLMVFQQFSGINAVIFFSSSILQSGGIDDPNEGGLIVMAVQVVMTGVAGALAAFHYNGAKPAWLALTSLVGYIVFFSLGLGAIPWLIMGEIFPGHVRALAASAATLLNWCLSFIVTESFASLLSALGPANTFTTFAAVCAVDPSTRVRTSCFSRPSISRSYAAAAHSYQPPRKSTLPRPRRSSASAIFAPKSSSHSSPSASTARSSTSYTSAVLPGTTGQRWLPAAP